MATTPAFIAAPRIGVGSITTGQTSRANNPASGLVDVITAGTNGTRILEIVVKADDDPNDSVVIIWLNDGTTSVIFDEYDIGNPAAGSTTSTAYRLSTTYSNLVLPSGWKLQASCTVTPTSGTIKVWAFGGNL